MVFARVCQNVILFCRVYQTESGGIVKKLLLTAVFLGLALQMGVAPALAQDTPEARLEAAGKYVKVIRVQPMVMDMVMMMAGRIDEQDRDAFVKFMQTELDFAALEGEIAKSLADNFTLEEISALYGFYSNDVGQSIINKMGKYTAESSTAIQRVLMDTVQGYKK